MWAAPPVATNATGDAVFAFARTLSLAGRFVTTTATSASGDTSEFSLAVRVSSPTAAQVSIAGRVVTEDGQGIPRTLVTLTRPDDGSTLSSQSSHLGYFRFVGLVAGRSYVLQFNSKSFEFDGSIFLTLTDSIDDLIVVARPKSDLDDPEEETNKAPSISKPDGLSAYKPTTKPDR